MPDIYKQITFETIVLTILAVIVLAVCVGCIYAFVRAIIMFIFSHGESEKIKKAYSSIRFMLLGIFLTVALLFVFPLLFKLMKVPNADQYSAKSIFNRAGEVLQSVSSVGHRLKDYQTETKNPYQPSGNSNYSL